jgi:hypothetical protein
VPGVAPLPERARLFHVGIPKSGTTSLQMVASAGREALHDNGVLYPGKRFNHRLAILGFMGRRWGWSNEAVPSRHHWDELMAEIERDDSRRVLFGHEFASEAKAETAAKFVESIGERCHVAITLRSPGEILPSAWQQYVKAGVPINFDEWLEAVIADPPNRKVTKGFHDRNDQAGVVQRWADAAGPDRVTVVVLDKKQPDLLFGAFEQLLDLPAGILAKQELGGFASNRGLTVPEVELFRAVNAVIRPHDVKWDDFERIIRNGAMRRIMEHRESDEAKPQLPPWAVKRAAEIGAGYADAIAATGVQVVGDLQKLGEEVPSREHVEPPPTDIPIELAAEAMAGMLSAATFRGAIFENDSIEEMKAKRLARMKRDINQFTTAEMVRVGFWFLGDRIRRALRRLRRRR